MQNVYMRPMGAVSTSFVLTFVQYPIMQRYLQIKKIFSIHNAKKSSKYVALIDL